MMVAWHTATSGGIKVGDLIVHCNVNQVRKVCTLVRSGIKYDRDFFYWGTGREVWLISELFSQAGRDVDRITSNSEKASIRSNGAVLL